MIDSVSSTTVPAFQTATFSAHLTASGVKPRRHTTCSSTDDVSRCDVICDLPQNFVVSCEQLVDVGVIGNWLTQSTLFKGAAQRITVNPTPAADDFFSEFSFFYLRFYYLSAIHLVNKVVCVFVQPRQEVDRLQVRDQTAHSRDRR